MLQHPRRQNHWESSPDHPSREPSLRIPRSHKEQISGLSWFTNTVIDLFNAHEQLPLQQQHSRAPENLAPTEPSVRIDFPCRKQRISGRRRRWPIATPYPILGAEAQWRYSYIENCMPGETKSASQYSAQLLQAKNRRQILAAALQVCGRFSVSE